MKISLLTLKLQFTLKGGMENY